jgi:hypothetical protein
VLVAWCVGYGLFMLYAATSSFLVVDYANLMFHEAGHRVFDWAGYYTQILGGTIGQLMVPIVCTIVFVRRGETTAVACCAFWTFQNLLNIATYMADARRSALPLVGGDESDWTILFTHWGVLPQDTMIAAVVRGIGWTGMVGSVAWLVANASSSDRPAHSPLRTSPGTSSATDPRPLRRRPG